MKNKIILVTGGARSGKSSFSEKLVRDTGEKRFYIATAPVLDDEMAKRVRHHQQTRANDDWITIEEQIDLYGALEKASAQGAEGILVDCLTLWLNNLLYRDPNFQEEDLFSILEPITARMKRIPCTIVLVINEVGLGLVPENELSRRFRDLSGRCSQRFASIADEVYLLVAGISLKIKG